MEGGGLLSLPVYPKLSFPLLFSRVTKSLDYGLYRMVWTRLILLDVTSASPLQPHFSVLPMITSDPHLGSHGKVDRFGGFLMVINGNEVGEGGYPVNVLASRAVCKPLGPKQRSEGGEAGGMHRDWEVGDPALLTKLESHSSAPAAWWPQAGPDGQG